MEDDLRAGLAEARRGLMLAMVLLAVGRGRLTPAQAEALTGLDAAELAEQREDFIEAAVEAWEQSQDGPEAA